MAKIREIAEWIGAGYEPAPVEIEITGVSSHAAATTHSLVFAQDVESLATAAASAAGAIIAPLDAEPSARILRVKHPKFAFALAASKLTPNRAPAGIHPTAVVVEPEKVGKGTSIGPYVVVAPNVSIGKDCQIFPHVTIFPGVTIGDNCIVQSGAVLGSIGFGYVRNPATGEYIQFPQQGTLVIEDNVEIGANTTIDRGALEETRIGAGTKIDNGVHIAHNVRIGKNVILAAQVGISGSCTIEDGAILGGQVGMGERVTIGEGVILGGAAGVLPGKTVRGPGELFWGVPARPVKDYLRDLANLRKLGRK